MWNLGLPAWTQAEVNAEGVKVNPERVRGSLLGTYAGV